MNYRPSTTEVISSAPSGSGNQDAVALHYSQYDLVNVDLIRAHARVLASSDAYFIQSLHGQSRALLLVLLLHQLHA